MDPNTNNQNTNTPNVQPVSQPVDSVAQTIVAPQPVAVQSPVLPEQPTPQTASQTIQQPAAISVNSGEALQPTQAPLTEQLPGAQTQSPNIAMQPPVSPIQAGQQIAAPMSAMSQAVSPEASVPQLSQVSNTPQPTVVQASNQQVQQPAMPTQPTVAPSISPQSDPTKKKPPLVTLAAQLTFRGSNEHKPTSAIGKVIGIVVVIITIAGCVGCILATQHIKAARHELKEYSNPNAAKKETDTKQAIKDSEPEKQKLNGGKLDVSKLFNAELAQRPQDIKAAVGEQINIANGLSFAVTGVERNWNTGDEYKKPDNGKEFVKIAVVTGSRTKAGGVTSSTYSFKALNSKGALQDSEYISDKILPNNELSTSTGAMSGGDSRSGWLVFEVTKGEVFNLVYEQKGYDYATSNGKEFLMKGTVEIK